MSVLSSPYVDYMDKDRSIEMKEKKELVNRKTEVLERSKEFIVLNLCLIHYVFLFFHLDTLTVGHIVYIRRKMNRRYYLTSFFFVSEADPLNK
jgi:hypothetical protein